VNVPAQLARPRKTRSDRVRSTVTWRGAGTPEARSSVRIDI
jgi:hypothetical protein